MKKNKFRELLRRYEGNPILTTADWPYPANSVFNAGATLLPNGETLLLVRVEDRRGISHLTVARSQDGITNWQIDPQPTFPPDPERYPEEIWGIEDPRITWIEELERYAITYTAFSTSGPLVSLALTRDFRVFERRGVIMPPEDKDAALFPRRFRGRWALIHRPISTYPTSRANIWISFSPDLKHWGDHTVLLEARQGAWWDANKIGLSPPPIETPEGWLIIYHGVRMTPAGCLYRLGLALLDLEDPRRVIRRSDEWIFGPDAPYERVGDVADVVFPCGAILDPKTGELRLYYGAADTSIALAIGQVREMLAWLLRGG
ncbi:MAG: glycosidase [Blastocatellia bacterium]|nr:glycosidase [Blastocatellia bacterium]MCS7156864.1 glycosidase [Blastocatellia bacterium]MCX7752822.1 glycosidase [Blastocatellia bacterium]MDW8167556.1 glycosidase [Acidobacteriota bacterium]MDW8256156.1 glycosidase [Acidobacteriota bacterium]